MPTAQEATPEAPGPVRCRRSEEKVLARGFMVVSQGRTGEVGYTALELASLNNFRALRYRGWLCFSSFWP